MAFESIGRGSLSISISSRFHRSKRTRNKNVELKFRAKQRFLHIFRSAVRNSKLFERTREGLLFCSFRCNDFPWIEARKARVARNERALRSGSENTEPRLGRVAARIMIDGSFRAKICRSGWNYRTSSAYSTDQRYRRGASCALRSYTKRHA